MAGEHFVSAACTVGWPPRSTPSGPRAGAPRVLVGPGPRLPARARRPRLRRSALARAGLDVVYVGGDLPPDSWVVAAPTQRPAAVVIGVPAAEDVPAVRDTVAAVAGPDPEVALLVGGGYQSEVGGATLTLGHAVGPAARQLVATLSGRAQPAR